MSTSNAKKARELIDQLLDVLPQLESRLAYPYQVKRTLESAMKHYDMRWVIGTMDGGRHLVWSNDNKNKWDLRFWSDNNHTSRVLIDASDQTIKNYAPLVERLVRLVRTRIVDSTPVETRFDRLVEVAQ